MGRICVVRVEYPFDGGRTLGVALTLNKARKIAKRHAKSQGLKIEWDVCGTLGETPGRHLGEQYYEIETFEIEE